MTSNNNEKDIFSNNDEETPVSTFVAITERQIWVLNKAGYTPNELNGMSKSTASKLINITKANEGKRLDVDQVRWLRDDIQNTRHLYLLPLGANLFPAQMKIDSEDLEYAIHASMDKEARKKHHKSDRRGTLFEIVENDATTAVQKAETLALLSQASLAATLAGILRRHRDQPKQCRQTGNHRPNVDRNLKRDQR